jgi:hypothetical protein|tara:strand:+ start:535 stop:858 length:324 start_codon:yes stop_codon:yes gene_type:complete
MTYEKIEQQIEQEFAQMISAKGYPEKAGWLRGQLVISRDLNDKLNKRLAQQIETLEKALDHAKNNHDVIFHNMRSMSFADGLEMGLEFSVDIAKYCDSDLSVKELTK